MTTLAATLLHLLSLVGAPAVLVGDSGTCVGAVDRMGQAHFPNCPESVLRSNPALYVEADRNDDPWTWSRADRVGDGWRVYF
jgi:hypothetical protein